MMGTIVYVVEGVLAVIVVPLVVYLTIKFIMCGTFLNRGRYKNGKNEADK